MNTGIADGYDLAWKLAAHVDNGAPERLLDTYNEERHALRKALQKTQYASLKYTTLTTPAPMRAAFRLLAGPILDHGGEYRVAQAFSELTLNTRRSPVTLDTMGRHGLRAGDRALDSPARHNGAPVQLYDLLYQGGWTLLAFEGRGRHRSPDRVRTALAQLGATPARQLRVASVDGPWPEVDTLWDLDGEVHRRYGIDRPALVLIRPDGHITARTRTEQYEAMRSHMATWGPSAAQRFAEASSPLGDRA